VFSVVAAVDVCFFLFFFFFQAEDGIRDLIVTGVQTCALPIYRWCFARCLGHRLNIQSSRPLAALARGEGPRREIVLHVAKGRLRSEERRVGKECRSRWWRYE